MTVIDVDDDEARGRFEAFDVDAYALFLPCKRLPESSIAYDWRTDSYTVTTSARFLPLLNGLPASTTTRRNELAAHLFGYQRWIVGRALDARRFAIWAGTGLGKTLMLLEWARHVAVDGPLLILAPRNVVAQTIEEATAFYRGGLDLQDLTARPDLDRWVGVDRHFERRLKNRHEAPRLCPRCVDAGATAERGLLLAGTGESTGIETGAA